MNKEELNKFLYDVWNDLLLIMKTEARQIVCPTCGKRNIHTVDCQQAQIKRRLENICVNCGCSGINHKKKFGVDKCDYCDCYKYVSFISKFRELKPVKFTTRCGCSKIAFGYDEAHKMLPIRVMLMDDYIQSITSICATTETIERIFKFYKEFDDHFEYKEV